MPGWQPPTEVPLVGIGWPSREAAHRQGDLQGYRGTTGYPPPRRTTGSLGGYRETQGRPHSRAARDGGEQCSYATLCARYLFVNPPMGMLRFARGV